MSCNFMPAIWSGNFISCNFMPCNMILQFQVLHFHVRHFQRPRNLPSEVILFTATRRPRSINVYRWMPPLWSVVIYNHGERVTLLTTFPICIDFVLRQRQLPEDDDEDGSEWSRQYPIGLLSISTYNITCLWSYEQITNVNAGEFSTSPCCL